VHFAKGGGLLVAIDGNTRSKTWYDVKTNKRGRLLEEFTIGNRMHFINEDSQITTFESSRGNSNVDLTIADNKMVALIKEWNCNEQESFSDHRIITYNIEKSGGAFTNYVYQGTKYITSAEDYKSFDRNFTAEIQHNFTLSKTGSLVDVLYTKISLETNIDGIVQKYQDSLTAACVLPGTEATRKNHRTQIGTVVDVGTQNNEEENECLAKTVPANQRGR
jgi:hypothetical protein